MLDYMMNMMGSYAPWMGFGSVTIVLVWIALVLAIIALWKYIQKK